MRFKPEMVDIRLVLTDTPPALGPVMMQCPFVKKHRDRQNSLAVYSGNVHCFGCDFRLARRYESLAFVLGLWDGCGDGTQAAREAGKVAHLYIGRPLSPKPTAIRPLNNCAALPYRIHLWGERPDRLQRLCEWRGVSKDTVELFKAGYDVCGRYVLPVYGAKGELITLRYRQDDDVAEEGDHKYTGMSGRNDTYLYPLWLLKEKLDAGAVGDLWVVEGELDTWPLWERGVVAVSLTNGAKQVYRVLEIMGAALDRPLSQVAKRIVIATDQDTAGNEAASHLSVVCDEAHMPWVRATWDSGKDITEYLRGGGRMEDIQYERHS